jgi:hypothetical protein
MPAASLVGGAEYRAPRARCRGEERHVAPGRAAPRTAASHEAGDLPGARPPFSYRQAGRANRIRGQAETGDGTQLSRICDFPPHHPSRSGKIVRPDLCARLAAARANSLRGAGRECFRDAEFDRCGLDFRNSVARRLPRIFCRKVPGRGPRSFLFPQVRRPWSESAWQT